MAYIGVLVPLPLFVLFLGNWYSDRASSVMQVFFLFMETSKVQPLWLLHSFAFSLADVMCLWDNSPPPPDFSKLRGRVIAVNRKSPDTLNMHLQGWGFPHLLYYKHPTEVNKFSFKLPSTWLDMEQNTTHLVLLFSNLSTNGNRSSERGIPLPCRTQRSKPTFWGKPLTQAGSKEVPQGFQVSLRGDFSCLQTPGW